MDHLDELESKSIYIIREAYKQFKDVAILWSIGKDSMTLLWLCRKAFYGKVPFEAIHIDTGHKFPEMYEFRDRYAKEWNLKLIIGKNGANEGMGPENGHLECCTDLKTNTLKSVIESRKLKALFLGIRRDEHGIRAKERYFSPRDVNFKWDYKDQPMELWDQYKSQADDETHIRVHPLLHWTEVDIWKYIQRENIPIVSLYFAKDKKRYRSLGCMPCCKPIDSNASTIEEIIKELENSEQAERAGRSQDKESAYIMQKLRALGYM